MRALKASGTNIADDVLDQGAEGEDISRRGEGEWDRADGIHNLPA